MKAIIQRIRTAAILAVLFAIGLASTARATAPTATAVWEAGEFEETKNGYSIALNGNTIDGDGNIVIGESTTAGATVKLTDVNASGENAITVLYKYKTLGTGGTKFFVSTYLRNSAATAGEDIGAIGWSSSNYKWVFAAQLSSGSWKNWYGTGWNAAGSTAPFDNALSADGGYVLFAFQAASTAKVYTGSTLGALAGQSNSSITYSSSTYNGTMEYIGVGGPTGQATGTGYYGVWPGMTIEKIAIFVGNAYTNEDLADYMWPSIERYQKWSYADSSRILTWTTPSTAGDDCIPNSATQYTVFDITNATDTATTYTDGTADSTTGANWHYFCYSSNVSDGYAAPGSVLRFVSGDYKKSLAASYSPVTYGGLIVEEGATGYSFASASRYSVLGDPTGATETWFEFNEDFTLGRSSGCHLTGTNNLSIASGKTFTIAGTTTKCATTAKSNSLSGTAGGTLKLHGDGKLAATLTASGATLDFTDLSATSSASTDAYIQGTVTVDDDTIIALPSGATFPYFIATGISGALDSETGVTIGGVAAPNYVAKADGSIIYSAPAEVIISSDAIWGSGDLDGWTTDDATKNYVINVTSDAILTLGSAVSLNKLTLNVSEGVTLTISGGHTITAADCIYVTGGGEVATSTAPTFSGTVKGDGTLYYNGVRPTTTGSDVVLTDSDWSGTVRITYNKENTATLTARQLFPQHWGSVNSKIKWNGVCGYFGGTTSKAGWVLEDLTVESTTYPALRKNDGGSSATDTIPSLSGSGTFADASNPTEIFKFADASEFNGAINITSSANYGMHVQFGATAVTKQARTITVLSGASVAVPEGKTWAAPGGIVVNGTLNANGTSASAITVNDGGVLNVASTASLTGAISGAGTVVGNQCFPVPGSSFTGTLTINAAAYPSSTDSDTTAIYGSTLNVASGVLKLTGNVATWPTTVNISSGAYLWIANTSMESLALTIATFEGMLYLEEAGGLTSLSLDIGSNRSLSAYRVALPSSATLATVNLTFDEVKGEGGTITLTYVSGIPAVEGRTYNFTVNRVDGTTVTGTYDSAASTVSYTPVISSATTDIDWDFTDGEDDALEQAPSGVSKNADSAMTFYTDATDSTKTGVYIKHHPYITGAASFMGNNSAAMTVAVVGTMPATQNTIFLNVGSAYSQQYGLVFVTTTNENEVLIGYNYGGTVTPITTMTVPNSSTARHSYIVTKEDGDSTTTFTVYLDGIKWKTVTTASKIVFASSNSGVQVGSDFGGNIRDAGTYSAASDDVGVLNVLRVYGRIITPAEIAVYADTFPYVSPNGASSRTFATATEDWVEATDTDWTNTDSSGTTTQGTTPSAGASVTVTADVATEITVNLASDTQYEALTINGSATTLAANSGSGKISVTGMTVIGAPVTVEYGAADFTGGPMTITEDGSITFDYSDYDISAIYTTTDIPLTSEVAEDADKVFLTPPQRFLPHGFARLYVRLLRDARHAKPSKRCGGVFQERISCKQHERHWLRHGVCRFRLHYADGDVPRRHDGNQR